MENKIHTKKNKRMIGFWIFFIMTALISFALFELGKNTLWGWGILLVFLTVWVVFRKKILAGKGFFKRLLAFLAGCGIICVIFAVSGPPERAIPAVDVEEPKLTATRNVAQGAVRGVYNGDGSVEVYAGIPYAKPPIGDLRWKEPQPPEPWEGIRTCDTFAPMSMQKRMSPVLSSLADIAIYHKFRIRLDDNWIEPMSEDSLYLNIWKPAGESGELPVVVYIHGGSLTTGQPSYSEYNGEALAKRGIIVVNFGYRLNVFGYYANDALAEESPNHTTGNYGLLDQIQALRWVKENISAFGGDPDNVTIAGESAGASAVNALCVSPLSTGLFQRAIAESSGITAKVPYHTFRSLQDALQMGQEIQSEFNADSISDLRSIPADKLVETAFTNDAMTVDGYALVEQPYLTYQKGNNHETALLQGFNLHEADLFTMTQKVNAEDYAEKLRPLYGQWAEEAVSLVPAKEQDAKYQYLIDAGGSAKGSFNTAVSAAWFSYSHYSWARLLAAQNVPVYTYYFTKDNGCLGSNHAGELPYFFGNIERRPDLYELSDEGLSDTMMEYYANFIRRGHPNDADFVYWPTWEEAPGEVLEFGDTIQVVRDPNLELYQLLDQYQDSLRKDTE